MLAMSAQTRQREPWVAGFPQSQAAMGVGGVGILRVRLRRGSLAAPGAHWGKWWLMAFCGVVVSSPVRVTVVARRNSDFSLASCPGVNLPPLVVEVHPVEVSLPLMVAVHWEHSQRGLVVGRMVGVLSVRGQHTT
jgi:hypothetical protein